MKIVLLGPPGAGKGTQAMFISNKYSIPHISTGDIFRKHISEKTELGIKADQYISKGQLVPDDLTVNLVMARIEEEDCKKGFLLDGFPRTLNQAKMFDEYLRKNNETLRIALLINLPNDKILERMTGRRVCLKCGATYHIKLNPPKKDGICDECGSKLIQRDDDTDETVMKRIKVYEVQTQPLINYYNNNNKLIVVDGTKSINEISQGISNILGSK